MVSRAQTIRAGVCSDAHRHPVDIPAEYRWSQKIRNELNVGGIMRLVSLGACIRPHDVSIFER